MAIAGFGEDQIDISQEGNLLTVKGEMGDDKTMNKSEYLYRGIANRNFERKFELADTVKVIEADLNNGLLSINLEREIPEHQKPRKIKVNTNSKLLSNGIDSTVQRKYFALIGIIFSSPVIKATFDGSTFLIILS